MQRTQRTSRSPGKAGITSDRFLAIQPFRRARRVRWPFRLSQRSGHGAAQAFYRRVQQGLQRNCAAIQARRRFQARRRAGPGLLEQSSALLAGSWNVLAGAIVCGLMLTLLMLVVPASLGIFVDHVLEDHGPWGGLVAALLGAGILVYLLSLLKHRFLQRLAVRISVIGYDRGLSRLLRLPVEFFAHRLVGDLTDRVSSIDRIAKNLTDQYLVLIIDMMMSAVLLVAMLAYDVVLTLIVLLLALLHGVLVHFLNSLRAVRSQAMRRRTGIADWHRHADAESCGQPAHDGIGRSILLALERSTGARAACAPAPVRTGPHVNGALPGLAIALRGAAILGLGGSMVIAGEMTLGTLVGFYILSEMFLAPVGRFLELADRRQALETDLQRLEDISRTAEDPVFRRRSPESGSIPTFNGRLRLAGQLELRDVTFGYNRSRPPLMKDFNLVIKPGQRVAGGRSQRFRQIDSGALGFRHLSAVGGRDPVRRPSAGRDSRGSAAAIRLHGGSGGRALFRVLARQHHPVEPGRSG